MSSNGKAYGPPNPHPLSQLRTELVWEGKYDEYGNRREVDVADHSMEYALNDNTKVDGVFQVVKEKFKVAGGRDLLATVKRIYDFRNTRVAHQEKEISDPKEAQQHLVGWIKGLKTLAEAGQ